MAEYFYKHLARAAGLTGVSPGQTIDVAVDLALAHDGTGPKVLNAWNKEENKLFDKRRVLFTVDHVFPAPTTQERTFQRQLADLAKAKGFALYNHGEGVLHQVVAEKYNPYPGMIIAGADGHVATSGAYGALAFALTPEELVPVLTKGTLNLKVPEVITFDLEGSPRKQVLPRDIALFLIGSYAAEIKGKAVALTGSFMADLSMAGRMTICNLLPEAGAVTAFVVPEGEIVSTNDHTIKVGSIEPMLAVPPEPTSVRPVRELAGTEITVAIVGGCSAGRIEDMEAVAEVLAESPVHPNVTLIVTPASQQVAKQMDERGISSLFREKGATVLPPGCGPCPGKHFGVLAPGDTAITTTVRNTPGRIGAQEANIYLASPRSVAEAAVRGRI